MSERRSHHLSEEQLAQGQDGRLPEREAIHLETCEECSHRLRDLQLAAAAYRTYLDSLRSPALPPPPQPWRPLDSLIAGSRAAGPRRVWGWRPVPAWAAAICLAVAIGLLPRRPSPPPAPRVSELLFRSAALELPDHGMVSLSVHGRPLVRPAVLVSGSAERDPEMAHLAMVFAQARYSWRDPLSARSFQSWRSGLREKRDNVTVIHGGDAEPAYRIRTDTPNGILRSAALTLQGRDLRPTRGAFQFEGEEPLEMEESGAAPPAVSRRTPSASKREPASLETPASPADTLHVLAALDAIGADVGEPIEISENSAHQVLVLATGLTRDRLQQVAAVLKPLAHVKLTVADATADAPPDTAQTGAPDRSSAGMPGSLREQFEDRLGGAIALQEMTDRVLEASGLAVARAHALEVLAAKFPPRVEASLSDPDRALLRRLKQAHLSAMRDLAARLQSDFGRLVAPGLATAEASSPDLVVAAQQVDDSLNRLLAGSYSEPTGKALLKSLGGQLAHFRQAIALQSER
jgi:hypothetical protein